MARAAPRIRHDRPPVSRSTARRDIAAVRQLYCLNREFAGAELERKRRPHLNALMAFAILALAVTAGFMVQFAPRCTDGASAPPTILIGGAIKVAGC